MHKIHSSLETNHLIHMCMYIYVHRHKCLNIQFYININFISIQIFFSNHNEPFILFSQVFFFTKFKKKVAYSLTHTSVHELNSAFSFSYPFVHVHKWAHKTLNRYLCICVHIHTDHLSINIIVMKHPIQVLVPLYSLSILVSSFHDTDTDTSKIKM